MKFVAILTIAIGLLTASPAMEKPSFHTQGTPTGKLKAGEYWWHLEISPEGPLMILIRSPEQLTHVYRNGIRIGRSTARLRFSPDFADKLGNAMKPGTTVIVTDYPVVRKPTTDSTYFAAD